ncbi:MAG: ELWxxDGT repeat protein [Acidobacteriota bacterium]
MRTALISTALLLAALPAFGLEPFLVKDINLEPEPASSDPNEFAALGSVALFAADDGLSGEELWRSDGTGAGTWQVADLCPGECSGGPRPFATTGSLEFFAAREEDDPISGPTLWVTDGTPSGTFRLTDSSLRLAGRAVWVAGPDVLYFPATDPEHGVELWRTDGTVAGTYLVADLWPGTIGSNAGSLALFKGRLYFTASDPVRGGALWRTDGTAAGTVPVKDPFPSSAKNFRPLTIGVAGGRLLFLAQPSPGPVELWSSDGTGKGTARIVTPGALSILDARIQGDRLYFVADDGRRGQELWVSDGTAKGTRAVTNLPRKEAFVSGQEFLDLPSLSPGLGNRFLFRANDGIHEVEPWVTDGTPKGTRLVRDLCPGLCDGAGFIWDATLAGRAFLNGTNGTRGEELWVTDGTEAGTRLVRDICRGSCGSYPYGLFAVRGRMVFAVLASDGGERGLWATDGTGAGTVRIYDFPFYGFDGEVVGDQLFLGIDGPEGRELRRTDGTAAGTRLVRDINQTDPEP